MVDAISTWTMNTPLEYLWSQLLITRTQGLSGNLLNIDSHKGLHVCPMKSSDTVCNDFFSSSWSTLSSLSSPPLHVEGGLQHWHFLVDRWSCCTVLVGPLVMIIFWVIMTFWGNFILSKHLSVFLNRDYHDEDDIEEEICNFKAILYQSHLLAFPIWWVVGFTMVSDSHLQHKFQHQNWGSSQCMYFW